MAVSDFLRRLPILLTLAACLAASASAQEHRLVPLDHWAYEYVHRLQRRGHLIDLHPTALPYTYGDVAAALETVDRDALRGPALRWVEALDDAFRMRDRGWAGRLGAVLQPGLRTSTSARMDPLRPASAHDGTLEVGSFALYPQAAARLFIEYGPAVAQAGLQFDVYYRDDPDGLDAANRLITRNEDAYVGIDTRYVSAYAGRFRNQWAPAGAQALIISDHPVGFDQIHLRIGGPRVALRSVAGELDSMTEDGRFTGVAGSDSVEASVRRFISVHRFDWRPTPRLALTVMESSIYSGSSSGFSLKFLNPVLLHAFAVDGRPKNDENNGVLAGMLWAQAGLWTLQGQLMLDDIDLMNATGEPPSLALSGSLAYAGFARADIEASLTAVSVRAYNSHQPDGRYTHLLRGLGAPFNDYVHVGAGAHLYAPHRSLDLSLTPRLDVLFQGAGEIHMPYPARAEDADFILTGTIQRVVRPALQIRVQGAGRWWLSVDAGPSFITNEHNVPSNDRTAFTMTASLKARLDVLSEIDGALP